MALNSCIINYCFIRGGKLGSHDIYKNGVSLLFWVSTPNRTTRSQKENPDADGDRQHCIGKNVQYTIVFTNRLAGEASLSTPAGNHRRIHHIGAARPRAESTRLVKASSTTGTPI
jgi:hypothetical protein